MTMPDQSPSYNPKACCGSECYLWGDAEDRPCWGDVEVVGEVYMEAEPEEDSEYWWIHACQGHKDVYDGGDYHPEEDKS
jgi:hypothetical protein